MFTAIGTAADLAPFVAVFVLSTALAAVAVLVSRRTELELRLDDPRERGPVQRRGDHRGVRRDARAGAAVRRDRQLGRLRRQLHRGRRVYVEHAFGTFRGRDEIRAWSVPTMTTFPGGVMTGFPLAWQVVDAPTSRLICEVRNLMPDPGDGSQLEESNLTIMTYAGDGLF